MMYLLPVSRDVPNSCLSCCTYVWCIQVWCICFLKNAWCTYFPCSKMYLILMYLIPVTQFLNDVPTSDVSKSVTSVLVAVLVIDVLSTSTTIHAIWWQWDTVKFLISMSHNFPPDFDINVPFLSHLLNLGFILRYVKWSDELRYIS